MIRARERSTLTLRLAIFGDPDGNDLYLAEVQKRD